VVAAARPAMLLWSTNDTVPLMGRRPGGLSLMRLLPGNHRLEPLSVFQVAHVLRQPGPWPDPATLDSQRVCAVVNVAERSRQIGLTLRAPGDTISLWWI